MPGAYGYGGYGSYGSYGGYGGYAPYGGYGGYMSPYMRRYGGGGGGFGDEAPGSFADRAELSSRTAFQAVESVVHAFGSVAMMLDATYQATYSSFRAVLGVAEHFSRLRQTLFGVLSPHSLIGLVRRIVRAVLRLLGFRLRTPEASDRAWPSDGPKPAVSDANDATGAVVATGASRSWPIVLFLGAVFGIPWIIWRLLAADISDDESSSVQHQQRRHDHTQAGAPAADGSGDDAPRGSLLSRYHVRRAVCRHAFAARDTDELSIRPGDELQVLVPRPGASTTAATPGWLRARLAVPDRVSGQRRSGYVPEGYIEFTGAARRAAACRTAARGRGLARRSLPVAPSASFRPSHPSSSRRCRF